MQDVNEGICITGSYTMPKVPNTYDKSELLNEAEPVDYSEAPGNGYSSSSSATGYQAQAQHPRIKPPRPGSRVPPRGIFDDV